MGAVRDISKLKTHPREQNRLVKNTNRGKEVPTAVKKFTAYSIASIIR